MKKIKILVTIVTILLFGCNKILAQNKKMIEVKTPNVSTMEKFGDVPVNLFTGMPDISIPLYTLQSGEINIPITLRYHASSVKPNQPPGWVGLGWDLQCIGSISRIQKYGVDEFYIPNSINSYYNKGFYPNPANGTSGSELLSTEVNWYTPNSLINTFAPNNQTYYDKEADEFNFNFFGHSGKFYYSADKKRWVVISDEEIKVEVNGFIDNREYSHSSYGVFYKYFPFNNPLNPISNSRYNTGNDSTLSSSQTRFFKEFTIITSDGIKYVFGGIEAMEFTSNFSSPFGNDVNLSSWLLKKIIDTKGKVVTFNYSRDYMHCNFYFSSGATTSSYTDLKWSTDAWFVDKRKSSGSSSNFSFINTSIFYGNFVYPMYLSEIQSDEQIISFSSNVANTLNYDYKTAINDPTYTQYNNAYGDYGRRQSEYGGNYGTTGYVTDGERQDFIKYFKFKKLNRITVTDRINNKSIKNYVLDYTEGSNVRFSLKSLSDYGNNLNSTLFKNYSFKYDDIASMREFGGNYTDHWGYFNNKPIGTTYSTVFANKETDKDFVAKGLISEIKYPTGGFTQFTWEAHDHSRVLAESKDKLISYIGYAGGSRIKKISNFSDNGLLANQKTYLYVGGFDTTKNLSSLTSSGILNGIPRYDYSFTDYKGVDGYTVYSFSKTGINSNVNYSSTGNGSHIGYDEVVEINLDGSYTKHFFTNYGIDINGLSHFDQVPLGYTGWKIGDQSMYMNFSSLELERGKTIAVYDYKNDNTLIKKVNYTFRDDMSRFDNFEKEITYSDSYTMGNDVLIFATSTKNFTYKYYPVYEEVTNFDTNGLKPITNRKYYSYNGENQLQEERVINSKVERLTTKYFYPQDFSTEPFMKNLIDANTIKTPIATEQYFFNDLLQKQKITYAKDASTANLVLPKSVYSAKFPNNIPFTTNVGNLEKKLTYDFYDTSGNLTQYTPEGGSPVSIVWGYNKTQPIAKIENATNAQLVSALGVSDFSAITEAQLSSLNNLRTNSTFSQSMITTYTYQPLVGVSSITDPKGDTVYYTYDGLGRLEYVKDAQGNILSKNEYHYKN